MTLNFTNSICQHWSDLRLQYTEVNSGPGNFQTKPFTWIVKGCLVVQYKYYKRWFLKPIFAFGFHIYHIHWQTSDALLKCRQNKSACHIQTTFYQPMRWHAGKKHTIQQGTSKCQDHGSRINWSMLYKTGFLNESLNIVWANSQVPDLTARMCSLIRALVIRTMPFATIPSPFLKFDFLNMPIWYDLSYNELSTEVISSPNSYWERSERRKILLWNGD